MLCSGCGGMGDAMGRVGGLFGADRGRPGQRCCDSGPGLVWFGLVWFGLVGVRQVVVTALVVVFWFGMMAEAFLLFALQVKSGT
jgi:hypothetical protein